jgi:hypothetical protein
MQSTRRPSPPTDLRIVSAACAIIPVGLAALTTFDYDSAFPTLLYFGVGMTVIGLFVTATFGRQLPGDTLRWRAAMNAMFVSLAAYILFAIIASSLEVTGLLSFGLTFAVILFLPAAFFTGYLVSFLFIRSGPTGRS